MNDFFGEPEASQNFPLEDNQESSTRGEGSADLLFGVLADRALTCAVAQNRIASTYLFYGPEGVGKWKAALRFAQFLNCSRRDIRSALTGACGNCPSCLQITAGTFPDLSLAFPMPSAKNQTEKIENLQYFKESKRANPYRIVSWDKQAGISIETAREIKKELSRTISVGSYRLAIFYQIEKMRAESLDALLRMIEEPPAQTVIILISNQPESLAATISSRCQKVRFSPIPLEKLERYLSEQADVPSKRAKLLARLAQGSPGEAYRLNQSSDKSDSEYTDRDLSWLCFKTCLLEKPSTALDITMRSLNLNNRSEAEKTLESWSGYLRDLLMVRLGTEDLIINIDRLADLRKLSFGLSLDSSFYALVDTFTTTSKNLRHNVAAPLAFASLEISLHNTLRS
ncbi:MAG: DNA polymerase III subunit delta' [candidate division Zixibacteria bacterium]|nr:DNA polymerase III subunit delta' [candidate division Zixibacteria bacterium]